MDGWRLQRQGRRWFLGIIIAHFPEILSRTIGCLEFIFRGSQMIKNKKLLLRVIGYLEIISHEIQVDRATSVAVTMHQPMTLFFFQSIDYQLVTYAY